MKRVLWILLFASLSGVLFQVLNRDFNHDELEAVHSAWKILHGEKIYVDFFQHHHPFFYYSLIPILVIFGESINSLIAIRLTSFVMLLLIFFVTYCLSENIFNRGVGIFSLALLAITPIFTNSAFEIRPDIPQTLFGLVALLFLFIYLKNRYLRYLITSSVALGISFLFLQKAIFLIFSIGILLTICTCRKQIPFSDYLIYFVVLLSTISPYYIYLIHEGHLYSYFIFNWVLNAKFLSQPSQFEILYGTLGYALLTNLLIWVFYCWSLKALIKNLKQKQFAFLSVSLLVSIIFTRTPHKQYFIMIIPLIAIISGAIFYSIFSKNKYRIFIKITIILYILISVLLFSFFSFCETRNSYHQLQKIGYVLSITNPKDFVYDGDINFNVFRKDISFFWFSVNPKMGALITYKTFNSYRYDIYNLINTFKPKVISSNYIDNMKDKRIFNHYIKSQLYKDLFIRIEKP
ncbi:MAG: glycosyltransferase family 39 protein [Chroococcidiopsidaceae cyanobacterium CP_BM_RX_35]|nr:glycosyltransferase family 39 protein [Chroococcidiopsidaceae cyanobacterium CP_BM_RX_35]